MEIVDRIAPSHHQLRPLKPEQNAAFPVYPDLVDKLARAASQPDSAIAHTMAVCAGYAYSTPETLAAIMARMGLNDNRCRMIAESVDAMFICSTSFLVQSEDGRVVVLAYRGTEPANLVNWLTSVDLYPEQVAIPLPGAAGMSGVHGGFYRNTRATRYAIIRALMRALSGKSVFDDGGKVEHPLEALYITGHSLGGAMAALMAVLLVSQPDHYGCIIKKLKAVYTFGQPMIGDRTLAAACQADPFLGRKLIRYIYQHDIVPHLPPKASVDFGHFGQELQYRRKEWRVNSKPAKQLRNVLNLALAPIAFVARQFKWFRKVPFRYSLDDHFPQHYVSALTPRCVSSEFGDW